MEMQIHGILTTAAIAVGCLVARPLHKIRRAGAALTRTRFGGHRASKRQNVVFADQETAEAAEQKANETFALELNTVQAAGADDACRQTINQQPKVEAVKHSDPLPMHGCKDASVEGLARTALHSYSCQECLAIFPDANLDSAIHNAIAQNQMIKVAEADVDAKVDVLKARFEAIKAELQSVGEQLQSAQAKDAAADPMRLTRLQDAMASLQQEKTQIFKQQSELRTQLWELYEEARDDQIELCDLLEACYTKNELMAQCQDEKEVHGTESVTKGPAAAPGSEIGSPTKPRDRGIVDAEPTSSSKQSVMVVEKEASKDEVAISPNVRELLYSFDGSREQLESAQLLFYNRDEQFMQARWQNDEAPAGERRLCSELEFNELRETQRLSRALADAEADYEAAKAALLAAKIQPPGSDIESGFVDDVDDGYRMSAELDYIESVDQDAIYRWLDSLPDWYTSILDAEADDGDEITDSDDWHAEQVEIWESRSMLAEGPARRRIDRWHESCNTAAFLSTVPTAQE